MTSAAIGGPFPDLSHAAGFVALVGPPNAGKSTLLNRLLGRKIAITSRKPQTTRTRILGIVHRPSAQLIFIDTPGVHHSRSLLNTRIVDAALGSLADADAVLLVIDATRADPPAEELILAKLEALRHPVLLALNKIDAIVKPRLLDLLARWSERRVFEALVPVSARDGTQVDVLLGAVERHLPAGPPLFPPDALTDRAERFLAAELIREKAIRLTGQEIPHAVAVTIDRFHEQAARVAIDATLHVERDSQKGILIGQGGRKLKQIGVQARRDIEELLDTRVRLQLFVRVQKNWRRSPRDLQRFGY